MSRSARIALTVLGYGAGIAILLSLLQLARYSLALGDLTTEIYLLVTGVPLLILGLYLGRRLQRPQQSPANPPESPLTDRELEILHSVARGLSNQQIADQRFVSLSTVKTHLRNIYGKLDVQRRTQAVERARQLGLL